MTAEVGSTTTPAAESAVLPPTIRRTRRQRRPSGAAPALPRSIGVSGKGWLITAGVLFVWIFLMQRSEWALRVTERADTALLRQIARLRTDVLTELVRVDQPLGVGLGRDRPRGGPPRRDRGVPPLAASLHVRRQRHRAGARRPLGLRPDLSAAPVRRDNHRSLARVCVSIRAGRGRHDHRGRRGLLDGRSGSATTDREARCRCHHRGAGRGASLSRGRSSLRHPCEHRGRGRAAGERLPVLRPQRGVPGLVPARQDRSPRRRWAPR